MRRFPARLRAARRALVSIALAAAGARAAETEFVTVFGDGLRAGDAPRAFACAAGVKIPEPDPAGGTNALEEARAAARGLAREIALAGFGMVRLPDLAVPRTGDPAAEARIAVQDEFVAACKNEGVRIWAEVLHPVLDFVPSPSDADALDDPATREAWQAAVADTNFPAASLLLAAPWDPRLEILVQRRLRDWARAFNPHTGLRRCDDPVYALFSFSTLWWDDLDAAALPALPSFFESGLADAWNDWLYERYGTDLAVRDRFPLEAGETLASNSVSFPPPERDPDSARTREQRTFLHRISTDHLSRLLSPFSAFGQTTRTAPRLVRHGGPEPFLKRFSTVAVAEPVRDASAPDPALPLVFDASRVRNPARGPATAAKAAAAGADVFVLPCGSDPAAWAPAAAAFSAGRGDAAALAAAARRGDGAFDFPSAARARLVVPAAGGEPSVAVFPAAGAAVAVARIPRGAPAAFPAELGDAGQPRRFLVCLPAEEPDSADGRDGGTDAEPAPSGTARPDAGRRLFDVVLFAPDGRPGSWVLRLLPDGGACYSVLARGPGLEKKVCETGSGAEPVPAAPGGAFRVDGLSGPSVLLFRPAAPGANLLRGL